MKCFIILYPTVSNNSITCPFPSSITTNDILCIRKNKMERDKLTQYFPRYNITKRYKVTYRNPYRRPILRNFAILVCI